VPPRAGAIAYPRYTWSVNSTQLVERLRDEQSVLVVPATSSGWMATCVSRSAASRRTSGGLERIDACCTRCPRR